MKHTPIWLHDFEKAFEIESETSLAYIEGRYKRPYQIPEKTYHHILRFIFFVLNY